MKILQIALLLSLQVSFAKAQDIDYKNLIINKNKLVSFMLTPFL